MTKDATISVSLHAATSCKHRKLNTCKADVLSFAGEDPNSINKLNLFLPPHVCEYVAAAFNEAMKLEPNSDRDFYYTDTLGHKWLIYKNDYFNNTWHIQSDEITGDDDPAFMTEGISAQSPVEAIPVIEAIAQENSCDRCKCLWPQEELSAGEDGFAYCNSCYDDQFTSWSEPPNETEAIFRAQDARFEENYGDRD